MKKNYASKLGIATLVMALAAPAFAQPGSYPLVTRYADRHGMLTELSVEQPSAYRPGARVFFSVQGEPGSRGMINMQTNRGLQSIPLSETEPGHYEGFYTVRRGDDFARASFTARLEKRGQVSEAWAAAENDRFWSDNTAWRRDHRGYAYGNGNGNGNGNRDYRAVCASCGVISSIRAVDEGSSEASAPGIVIGGLVGGLLGNQVGGGHGRDAATILGALGGGVLGNELGQNQNHRQVWIITVNLDNGGTQRFRNTDRPNIQEGQRVRVENNQLFPQPR